MGITPIDMTPCDCANDSDIRLAFHAKYLRRARLQPNTLVVDELGLAHARSRVDVAVINGCIHGYEIKSARDSLVRLARQIDIYRQTLQKLTLVAADKHVADLLRLIPNWCGMIEARQGPRGGIRFESLRVARVNPDVDPVMMAHLLWRSEVVAWLLQAGYAPKELRRPRKQLYEMLCAALGAQEIGTCIRSFMMQRSTWRDRSAPA